MSLTAGTLIARYGLAAIAVGAMAEGESVLLVGGMLAHRGTLDPATVVAVAIAATVATDQLCFFLGRRHRDSRLVTRARANPAFARALGFIERWPTGYTLAFRFLYGLRVVSPVALGISRVPASRFVVLNLIAASLWASIFVALGYVFAGAIDRLLGRVASIEHYLLVAFAVAAVLLLASRLWAAGRRRR